MYENFETQFYLSVVRGDFESLKKVSGEYWLPNIEKEGALSQDPLLNSKYHFIVTGSMISRLCRENGLGTEEEAAMKEYYIEKLDSMHTVSDVSKLLEEMILDYTRRMYHLSQLNNSSRHVNDCKMYIDKHITERTTVEEIADQIGVSAAYLSRLFKKETGESVSGYIRLLKIEKAKDLLRYSKRSIFEIADHLSFSSQSHFIQLFKGYVGMTPRKYREQFYMQPRGGES